MVEIESKSEGTSAERSIDVLVVGGGPAGLCFSAEAAKLGLRTTVIASGLGEIWEKSYGVFAKDLAGVDLTEAVRKSFNRPLVTVTGREPIDLGEQYLRFDTGGLQSLLFQRAAKAGVRFLSGTVNSVEFDSASNTTVCKTTLAPGPGDAHSDTRGANIRATLVVDASGGRLLEPGAKATIPMGYQSAYGEWVEVPDHPFAEDEMSLMDYRAVGSAGPASFMYAMPETGTARGPGTVFVQETVLVGESPVSMGRLRERLFQRLSLLGIRPTRTLGTERCVIPLGGALPAKHGILLPFGASAGFIHPATGYQLATAFHLAPQIARIVAERLPLGAPAVVASALEEMWPDSKRRAYRFYELGAFTLGTFSPEVMEEFIGDFFCLPGRRWQRFMAGTMDSTEIAETMWRVFARARGSLRTRLLGGASRATSRLFSEKPN